MPDDDATPLSKGSPDKQIESAIAGELFSGAAGNQTVSSNANAQKKAPTDSSLAWSEPISSSAVNQMSMPSSAVRNFLFHADSQLSPIKHATELQFLVFSIEQTPMALQLSSVEQVCAVVEITPLPDCPEVVAGLINVHGSIVVVLDLRKKLRLAERDIELSDQLVIANADERQFALLVDDVQEVIQFSRDQWLHQTAKIEQSQTINVGGREIAVCDLTKFLSSEEEEKLNQALYLAFLDS